MKGHNFKDICRKCGKNHKHPKGMQDKKHSNKTKEKFKNRIPWNKNIKTGIIPKSAFKKGKDNPMYGKKVPDKIKYILSLSKMGEKNPNWKGDNVTYNPLHNWIRRHKPKSKFCEICNKLPPYDLSNISGKYKRDVNDFKWLCRSCHMKEDYKSGIRKGKGNG